MKKSENYDLNLPEAKDNYSGEDTNENMSIIDAKLKEQSDELDEVQTEIDGVQTAMGGVQAEIDGVQAEMDVVQSTLASVQTTLETMSEEEPVETGVKVNIDKIFSNNDTRIVLTGYLLGEEASLNVSGYVGKDTVENNLHLTQIVEDTEYSKFFQQFNINVNLPYGTSGFRSATVSVMMGENVVNEYIFKEKATGKTITTYEIGDYISNSAYEWSGTNTFNGIELFFQNMPEASLTTYPLCINASASCLWEGK